MSPVLQPGDSIQIEWNKTGQPTVFAEGDLILARSDAQGTGWIVHRVVSCVSDQDLLRYQIKGDASFVWDDFTPEQIWGKVVAIRSACGEREFPHQPDRLDRLICFFSRLTVPSETLRARIARKCVRALGWLKRSLS